MELLEYWKPIPGYDRYEASYSGKIRHCGKVIQRRGYNFDWAFPRTIKPYLCGQYLMITLSEYGKSTPKTVHTLVALAFLENHYNLLEVNHLDGIKTNNNASNLQWCTHKQNMEHAVRMGLTRNCGRRRTNTAK